MLQDFISMFIEPYLVQARKNMLKIELIFANDIPASIQSDWTLYLEILF